jgi:vacuolar-type H+-ATPase subunit I/STV1
MTNSTLIARLMGPLLLVLGVGMLIGLLGDGEAEYMTMLRGFMADIPLIIVFGMLTLVAGLAIVNAHNLWVTDWRVIITVLGWLAIIRGVVAILFPVKVHEIGETAMATPTGPTTGAIIILVLGAILVWMGYEELCRADKRRPAPARSTTPRKRSSSATRKRPRRRSR